ncbi:MAG TPA: hypothetical protein VIK33_13370 [Anaerolineae bacterium]
MGSLTDFAENELLDHVCNAAYTPVATVYLALATADPTDAATGASMSEVANSGAYARTAITFGAAASRRVTQSGVVTFPQASGAWGTVTHWAIVDTGTYGSGNVLAHGAFAVGKSIVSGNTPSVASAEVYVEYSAGEISDYLANKLLDLMFRNTAYAKPDTYVALVTATVTDSNTGSTITEPSGGAYARKQVNVNGGASPTWDLAASSVVDNTHAVTFAQASASWGTVVGVAIVDAATVGNLLMYDNAMADQAVGSGDTVSFPIGDLDVQMS